MAVRRQKIWKFFLKAELLQRLFSGRTIDYMDFRCCIYLVDDDSFHRVYIVVTALKIIVKHRPPLTYVHYYYYRFTAITRQFVLQISC